MHVLFLIYSLSTVISKKIGGAEPLSLPCLIGFGLIFLCLGIYALGWQKVLKVMPLSKAFAHKAVVVIWGLFWGWALFGETLTPARIAGAAVIICGVLLFASEEKSGESPAAGAAEAQPIQSEDLPSRAETAPGQQESASTESNAEEASRHE